MLDPQFEMLHPSGAGSTTPASPVAPRVVVVTFSSRFPSRDKETSLTDRSSPIGEGVVVLRAWSCQPI